MRPLTAHKSFLRSVSNISRALRKPEDIPQFDKAYERDLTNRLGPGPAAYQSILKVERNVAKLKGTTFGSAERPLSQGRPGPGPAKYRNNEV